MQHYQDFKSQNVHKAPVFEKHEPIQIDQQRKAIEKEQQFRLGKIDKVNNSREEMVSKAIEDKKNKDKNKEIAKGKDAAKALKEAPKH